MFPEKDDWFISLLKESYKGKELPESEELKDIIDKTIEKALPEAAEVLYKSLISKGLEMLNEHRLIRTEFEAKLERRWFKPLSLLEMLIVSNIEAGEEFSNEFQEEVSKNNDYVFEVLCRLHARGCQISYEILNLLKSGFADGAHARWRSLHEIATTSVFIKKYGNDLAKRFLDYQVIENYEEAKNYQDYCEQIGYEPLTNTEFQAIEQERKNVIDIYGSNFAKPYGWAANNLTQTQFFRYREKSWT